MIFWLIPSLLLFESVAALNQQPGALCVGRDRSKQTAVGVDVCGEDVREHAFKHRSARVVIAFVELVRIAVCVGVSWVRGGRLVFPPLQMDAPFLEEARDALLLLLLLLIHLLQAFVSWATSGQSISNTEQSGSVSTRGSFLLLLLRFFVVLVLRFCCGSDAAAAACDLFFGMIGSFCLAQ